MEKKLAKLPEKNLLLKSFIDEQCDEELEGRVPSSGEDGLASPVQPHAAALDSDHPGPRHRQHPACRGTACHQGGRGLERFRPKQYLCCGE